jgi:hypothetical protein
MNDIIRYKGVGTTYFGITQESADDILDTRHMTWTNDQMEHDLLNKVLPVGLLLMDLQSGKLYKVMSKAVQHGHRHVIESVNKENIIG